MNLADLMHMPLMQATRLGRLVDVASTTRRLLTGRGGRPQADDLAAGFDTFSDRSGRTDRAAWPDVPARPAAPGGPAAPSAARSPTALAPAPVSAGPATVVPADDRSAAARPPAGRFESRMFVNRAGMRAYKLYVPAGHAGRVLPLIVMLHGCTQSPEDFASGSRMNALADRHGFLVAYPAQSKVANASRCWNWYEPSDQRRDSGEPSLIAGIVREIAARDDVDERRIYVAGLSAGGAMAAILAQTYPDLFAAIGVHSGLPVGAAHDLRSAFEAMKRGATVGRPVAREPGPAAPVVPAIVFHGDRDYTVNPRNGMELVRQLRGRHAMARSAGQTSRLTAQKGRAPGGRTFTRTVQADDGGRPLIEYWQLHGAGHAWAGGSEDGTYTDPRGPDASAEMVRFFSAHARAA